MVENVRRKIALIVTLVVAAVFLISYLGINLGLDLRGGTRLVYQVDFAAAVRRHDVSATDDPAQVLRDMISVIRNRIDPDGVLDAGIVPQGADRILIELPGEDNIQTEAIIRRISELGHLEMRMVADGGYNKEGVSFDLNKEQEILKDWLAKPENLAKVERDPNNIHEFNSSKTDAGSSPHLQWYPLYATLVERTESKPAAEGQPATEVTKKVWVYEPQGIAGMHPASPTDDTTPRFAPLNMHEISFTGKDLVPSAIRATTSEKGEPAVAYEIVAGRASAYSALSAANIGKQKAIVLNNMIRVAPTFESRIPGRGQITLGRASSEEVASLVLTLKTGSLKIKPEMVSRSSLGPNLGRKAIEQGSLSLAIGTALVVLFMLIYYRFAGIVAVSGLIVNMTLLIGCMAGIGATLTLPGIAGLVLTIGMAVDANILIYERIREERLRGKGLAQAVKAGFDRALSAILDSNITTFLVGVILYVIGSGPVRGFAVTLMIGIATSLFAGVFYAKVLFHVLVHGAKIERLHMQNVLGKINVPWMKYRKIGLTASAALTVASLALFFVVPDDVKFGQDFTGGASVRVALREPIRSNELRRLLVEGQGAKFGRDKEYPDPAITTTGEVDDQGRSTQFSIKLKLSAAQSEEFARQQAAAAEKDEPFQLPLVDVLKTALQGKLVDDPFGELKFFREPGQTDVETIVHFLNPVRQEDLLRAMEMHSKPVVTPVEGETDPAKTYKIVCSMNPTITTKEGVIAELSQATKGLKDTEGRPVELSSPVPEAELVGKRAADDLTESATQAILLALGMIILYVRVRFHEYKYGIGAVCSLIHDVLITMGAVVLVHWIGLVNVEIDLALVAVFLTVIGYSVNDTIVVFDRLRENLEVNAKLGTREGYDSVMDRAINQTFTRTIWTTATTLVVVLCQFFLNWGTGSPLEGFAFPMIIGLITGSYSTIMIAAPVALWIQQRAQGQPGGRDTGTESGGQATAGKPTKKAAVNPA